MLPRLGRCRRLGEGLVAVLVPDEADRVGRHRARARWRDIFGDRGLSGADPSPPAQRRAAAARARRARRAATACATVVTNDVLFHSPDSACCRMSSPASATMHDRRARLPPRALRRPLSQAARRRWSGCSRAIPRRSRARSRSPSAAASRCDELGYQYPDEIVMPGRTPQQALEKLTWEGAAALFPEGVPDKVSRPARA